MERELKEAIDRAVEPVMSAFEAFKAANDERLDEIAKSGAARPETEAKLVEIEQTLASYETLNRRMIAAEQAQKEAENARVEAESDGARLQQRIAEVETRLNRPGAGGAAERADILRERVNVWVRGVFGAYRVGLQNLPADQLKAIDETRAEYKALNITDDSSAGYLAPIEYVQEIIKGVTERSPARSIARVRTTAMRSIQIPKRTGQFAAMRTTEQGTRSETTGLAYGLEEITAPEMYALIDISEQSIEDTMFDMEAELRTEAEDQFAVLEGAEFITGSGVGEMEGILATSAAVGSTISGAATAITADGLISTKHAISSQYARNAIWIMNRTTLGSVRKLKDGVGQYYWQPGIAQGRPATIDGDPYVEFPDMPSEAAGAYPVAYGDFRRAYTMVDRVAMTMLRDQYTQATSGNIRFLFRRRGGGQVVLAEAIRLNKCSA